MDTGTTPIMVAEVVVRWLQEIKTFLLYERTTHTLKFLFQLLNAWEQAPKWRECYWYRLNLVHPLYAYLHSIRYEEKRDRINIEKTKVLEMVRTLQTRLVHDYQAKFGTYRRLSRELVLMWLFYITHGDILMQHNLIPPVLDHLLKEEQGNKPRNLYDFLAVEETANATS